MCRVVSQSDTAVLGADSFLAGNLSSVGHKYCVLVPGREYRHAPTRISTCTRPPESIIRKRDELQ